mmetsp:Transcript_27501/g.89584  ORF Transcript_27501/g.89584 Transcript_27501/m.89584 type:complete len:530 (-) Transcript_27501:228-1817(-)
MPPMSVGSQGSRSNAGSRPASHAEHKSVASASSARSASETQSQLMLQVGIENKFTHRAHDKPRPSILNAATLSSLVVDDELETLPMDAITSFGFNSQADYEARRMPTDARDPEFLDKVSNLVLNNDPRVRELNLSSAGLQDSHIPHIADALALNTTLRTVNLSTNLLSDLSVKELAAGIKGCPSIRKLDLAENSLGSRGAGYLSTVLDSKTSLVGLDISVNLIRDEGANAIIESLVHTPHQPISWLNLSENSLSDFSAPSIANLIRMSANLTHLDISRNDFQNDGIRVLADELALCSNLRHLNISNIQLDSNVVEHFTLSLGQNSSLQTLDMYGCMIGDVGGTSMCRALATNTTLLKLDLGANRICARGFEFIADGIRMNTTLKVLKLWGNKFQGECERLISALFLNDTLIEVELTGCELNPDQIRTAEDLVRKNRNADLVKGQGQVDIWKALRQRDALLEENRQLKEQVAKLSKKPKSSFPMFTTSQPEEKVVEEEPEPWWSLKSLGHLPPWLNSQTNELPETLTEGK